MVAGITLVMKVDFTSWNGHEHCASTRLGFVTVPWQTFGQWLMSSCCKDVNSEALRIPEAQYMLCALSTLAHVCDEHNRHQLTWPPWLQAERVNATNFSLNML